MDKKSDRLLESPLVAVVNPSGNEVPPLKELLRDPDVANFYQLIYENNLRIQALDLLEKRLGSRD